MRVKGFRVYGMRLKIKDLDPSLYELQSIFPA